MSNPSSSSPPALPAPTTFSNIPSLSLPAGIVLTSSEKEALRTAKLNSLLRFLAPEETAVKRSNAIEQLIVFVTKPENENAIVKVFDGKVPYSLKQLLGDRDPKMRAGAIAVLLPILPFLRKECHPFFQWIFGCLKVLQTPKEIKQDLLLLLKEFIEQNEPSVIEPHVSVLLSSILTFLDETDQQELVIIMVQIIQLLIDKHSELCKPSFSDLVDFLIGWSIDPLVSEACSTVINDSFKNFRTMWASDMTFSLDILGKLLVDLETLINEKNPPSDAFSRFLAFLQCQLSIMQGISTFTDKEVGVLIPRLLGCLMRAREKQNDFPQLYLAAEVLATLFGERFVPYHWQLQHLLFSRHDASFIKSIRKGIDVHLEICQRLYNSQPPSQWIRRVIGFRTPLSRLRLHPSFAVASGVLNTYLWALERLNDIELAMTFIYNEIDIVFSTLNKKVEGPSVDSTPPSTDNFPSPIILTDAFSEDGSNQSNSSTNATLNTTSPNHSLSGQLDGLPKRLRDHEAVNLCRKLFNQQEAALLCCFNLQLLIAFVKQTEASANLLTIATTLACRFNPFAESIVDTAFLRVSFIQTLTYLLKTYGRANFEYRQFADIARIASRDLNFRVRVSAANLSYIILNSVVITSSCHDDLFFSLLKLLHDTENAVRRNTCRLLQELSLAHKLSTRHSSLIPKEILRSCSEVSTTFDTLRDLLELLSIVSGACSSSYYPHQNTPIVATPASISTLISSSISASNYKSNFFAATIALLSQRQDMGVGYEWFARFFVDCDIPQSLTALSREKDPYPWKDLEVTTFWALWEAARYCVNSKLRTSFGGPVQTFEGIEKMLQSSIQKSQAGGRLTPFRQLLQFVDYLERHIYNAYEGSLNLPPNNQKTATTFFKANRKVCEDWFARMRPSLMASSLASYSPASTVRHSFQRILDLQGVALRGGSNPKLKTEIETTFRNLCLALLEMKEQDTLEGVFHWSRSVFRGSPRAVPWLPGVIAQSKGQFEQAIKEYSAVLETDALSSFDPSSVRFTVNQAVECCYILSDWDALNEVLNVMTSAQNKPENNSLTIAPTHYDLDYLRALSKFDNGHQEEAKYLMNSVSPNGTFAKIESDILRWMVSSESSDELLLSSRRQLEDHLRSLGSDDFATPYLTQLHCLWLLIHRSSPTVHHEIEDPHFSCTNSSGRDLRSMIQVFRVMSHLRQTSSKEDASSHLLLPLVRTARKQGNHRLAQRYLVKAGSSPLAEFERARLDLSQGNTQGASTRMLRLFSSLVEGEQVIPTYRSLASSVSRKLGKWLEALETQSLPVDYSTELLSTARAVPFFTRSEDSKVLPSGDLSGIAGICRRISTQVDPDSAKGWAEFADWCFRVGRDLLNPSGKGSSHHQEARRSAMELLTRSSVEVDANSIAALCDSLSHLALRDAEFDDQLNDDEAATGEHSRYSLMLKEASRRCPQVTKEILDELVAIWLTIRKQALSYYSEATSSYFRFLRLQTESTSLGNITATLRLLHLLVNFSDELSEVLASGFKETPTVCWQDIIPQMFAHLGHPEEEVRQEVKTLLSRLGEIHPHLVVYSAVVGCETSPAGSQQQKLFQQIISELHANFPRLIEETSLMIEEFKRITMFWEEQWMILLNHLHVDVHSRIRTAKEEVGRVSESDSLNPEEKARLIREKYSMIMKPVVMRLEQLQKETSSPETPHECWFFNTYGAIISRNLEMIRNPVDILNGLSTVWQPFHDLSKELARLHLKPITVKLRDISPLLSKIHSSKISLPGVHSASFDDIVTIQSFEPSVAILPTKTRPKKITLLGSDGREYAYLIKGREDLHLDERIMQFLNITNQVLNKDRQTSARKLRARHYAVIPLSERSGLIQWVSGAVPLFSVYKHWQRRSAAAKSTTSPAGTNLPTAAQPQAPTITRPSDMFYGKIIPALKEKGITNVASRKDWPFDVLKRVFVELVAETPNWLLSKELWCSSSNTLEWWQKSKGYVRSTAVMSIVGYVLGLGDRHLDNILIDFSTGEVVHIDYNVCFEKGLHLRIPETVPFRLTQNMIHALGPTGVEGAFRIACEQAMRVLRENKEVLLTLLEAFVYDPLVDWAVDRTDNEARKNLEVNVSLSLFASRIEEMKTALEENKERLTNVFFEVHQPILDLGTAEATWKQLTVAYEESVTRRNTLKMALGKSFSSSPEETNGETNKEAQRMAGQSSEIITSLTISLRESKTRQENINSSFRSLLSTTELSSLQDFAIPSVLEQSIPIFLELPAQVALSHGVVDPFLKRLREGEASMTNVIDTQQKLYDQLVQHLLSYRNTIVQKGTDPSSNLCQVWINLLEQLIETPFSSDKVAKVREGLLCQDNFSQDTSTYEPILATDLQSFRETSERLSIEECERRYASLQTEVNQKLTAVFCNTNPAVIRSWQELVTQRSKALNNLRMKVRKALQLASGLLEFERFSSSAEHKRSFVKHGLSLLDKLKEIGEQQPHFDLQWVKLKFKDILEGGNQLISSEFKKVEEDVQRLRREIENIRMVSKEKREAVKRLRGPINEAAERDTQVMSEIMSLLMTTVKITERLESVRDIHKAAKNLHVIHSTFTSRLSKFIKELSLIDSNSSGSGNGGDVTSMSPLSSEIDLTFKARELQKLISGAEKIQSNLLQISQLSSAHTSNAWQEAPGSQQSGGSSSSSDTPTTENPEVTDGERGVVGKKPTTRTTTGGIGAGGAGAGGGIAGAAGVGGGVTSTTATTTRRQGMQQNVHAMNVVKRVESKLQGLDHLEAILAKEKEKEKDSPSSTLTTTTSSTTTTAFTSATQQQQREVVAETIKNQVDRVIQQATNADNLCMLYEGWTPWI